MSAADSPSVTEPGLRELPALLAASALDSAGGAPQSQHWHAVIDVEQLRLIRLQRGLSQEKLAWKAGVSPSTINKLERQKRPSCYIRTLALIAAALDVSPSVIVLDKNSAESGHHG